MLLSQDNMPYEANFSLPGPPPQLPICWPVALLATCCRTVSNKAQAEASVACTSPTLRGMAENGAGSARLAGSVGDEDGGRRQLVVASRGTVGWGHQGRPAYDEVPAPVALTAGIFSTASSPPALASKPPPSQGCPSWEPASPHGTQ